MARKKESEYYLEFRYLKNVMVNFGDAGTFPIPVSMKHLPPEVTGLERQVLVPVYDLSKIHRVELKDETPRVPVKPPSMSSRLHEELCDAAYRLATENKKHNDAVRERIEAYCDSGSLELVSDPFATVMVADSADLDEKQPGEDPDSTDDGTAKPTKTTSTRKK